MKMLKHENVVALHYCLDPGRDPDKQYLVMELMEFDLATYLKATFDTELLFGASASVPAPRLGLLAHVVQKFARDLCQGVAYCHGQGVMHRDLKPQNLLISRDYTLKIADFGMALPYCSSAVERCSGYHVGAHDAPRSSRSRCLTFES